MERITGAMILDDAVAFSKQVTCMKDEMHDALVLAAMVSHALDSFTTVPRVLATAPEKQSGKTTLLNEFAMLANNAWDPDSTSFALRAKFNEREKPTLLFDEISDVYGRSGMRSGSKDLNTILKKGYQSTATLSLSVDRVPVDVSCYCMAALGGLRNAVPDDIFDRSIVFKMTPVSASIYLLDSLDEDTRALGKQHMLRMHQWARENVAAIKLAFRNFKRPHKKMFSRLRQIWGPLYAVALVAGDDWGERCIAAFKAMALDASGEPVLTGSQMVLRDAAHLFESTGAPKLFARDIMEHLQTIDEDLYNTLSTRGYGLTITEALGPSQSMDIVTRGTTERAKGYHAKPVLTKWRKLEALLNPQEDESIPSDEFEDMFEVATIE